MQKISILGDSILRGVQFEDDSRRYVVQDELGFDAIAQKSGLTVRNLSKFGCTITKAWDYVQRMFPRMDCDLVFMDFGGNDCDFNWKAIAESPLALHGPNTEIQKFKDTYDDLVDYMKARGVMPVLSTLVPVQSDLYIEHVCRTSNLNRKGILQWIGNGNRVENSQQIYSDAIKGIALSHEIPLVDVRAAFQAKGDVRSLLCADGIHPNRRGQAVIHDCFASFMDDFIVL